MTTDPQNNQTRSGLKLNPEQTATDTNRVKRYRIDIAFMQFSRSTVIIHAHSARHARRQAQGLQPAQLGISNAVNGTLIVGNAQRVNESANHA